jgi:hypothetical protein
VSRGRGFPQGLLEKSGEENDLLAEWTSDDGTTESFFDYVLKKTVKN